MRVFVITKGFSDEKEAGDGLLVLALDPDPQMYIQNSNHYLLSESCI